MNKKSKTKEYLGILVGVIAVVVEILDFIHVISWSDYPYFNLIMAMIVIFSLKLMIEGRGRDFPPLKNPGIRNKWW